MNTQIGIRREDINKWERRVPLIPSHARELVDRHSLKIRVQPSEIRVFTDEDYRVSGIPVVEDLGPCPVIFAIKEVPVERLEKNKTYVIFSHTAKGQKYNMPMLKRMTELGCSLIDYEKMVDDKGRRVLYFGNFAGHAGVIDTLWALGRRLAWEGTPNPFTLLEPTHRYASLVEAREAVGRVAAKIVREGLPAGMGPVVLGFFGYGHVSQGAQDTFKLLPVESVEPGDLPKLFAGRRDTSRRLFMSVFKEEDMVEPLDPGRPFELQHSYHHPEAYRSVVDRYLPYLTAIVNGIYWTSDFPRFVTKASLKELYGGKEPPRLRVIGDITCDVNGSIESTVQATDSTNPVYVYDPETDAVRFGVEGRGPVVLAVYNLPAELPLESSTYFSGRLKEYVPAISGADFQGTFEACGLPGDVRRGVILYRGGLTPDFLYLGRHVG